MPLSGFLNVLKILEVSLTIMLSTASVSTHYTGQAALRGETNDGEADSHCDGELEKEGENDEEMRKMIVMNETLIGLLCCPAKPN